MSTARLTPPPHKRKSPRNSCIASVPAAHKRTDPQPLRKRCEPEICRLLQKSRPARRPTEVGDYIHNYALDITSESES